MENFSFERLGNRFQTEVKLQLGKWLKTDIKRKFYLVLHLDSQAAKTILRTRASSALGCREALEEFAKKNVVKLK